MNVFDFDYELDEKYIRQTPIKNRSESKLMILDKLSGNMVHTKFFDIINYLEEGDVLVLNDTKVLPARIYGKKEDTNANIELLLLKNIDKDIWECLSRPYKRLHIQIICRHICLN